MKWILVLIASVAYSQEVDWVVDKNSTDCFNAYTQNKIETKCGNETACCFYEVSYLDNTSYSCHEKEDEQDYICDNMNDYISFVGGSLSVCECAAAPLTLTLLCLFTIFF